MWWSTQPSNGIDAATFRAMSVQKLKQHLHDFHAGWHDPIPRIIDAAETIVVTDTLDVATLPTWSRGRTLLIGDAAHATPCRPGRVDRTRGRHAAFAVDARRTGVHGHLPAL